MGPFPPTLTLANVPLQHANVAPQGLMQHRREDAERPDNHARPAQLEAPVAVLQRVAYQGAPGAYSEGAALKAVPGGEPLPCEQFEVAFQALSQWLADRAVLPIENSVGGSIHTVYDLLMRCAACAGP